MSNNPNLDRANRPVARQSTPKEKSLDDQEILLRRYLKARRERRAELASGPYGAEFIQLDRFLQAMTLRQAGELVALVKSGPWREADSATRYDVLSIINEGIGKLRRHNNLLEIDDPLPDQPPSAFILIREYLK